MNTLLRLFRILMGKCPECGGETRTAPPLHDGDPIITWCPKPSCNYSVEVW